jgi:2-polyprenyl-6-hydroxyphenyl methylase/3-demethylubiquinone-9 3-methyltransferase
MYRLQREFGTFLLEQIRSVQHASRQTTVLEVGAGNSIWLPFLAEHSGCAVTGVDFSEEGCRLAEVNLAAMGMAGRIVQGDFFSYAAATTDRFDVVISFGFIEHFADTAAVLTLMRTLLTKDGLLIATIPNWPGVYGAMQRVIDGQVLDMHVIMTPEDLEAHARAAGLHDIRVGFVGGASGLGLLHFAHVGWLRGTPARYLGRGFAQLDAVIRAVLRPLGLNRNQRRTSPYSYVVGRRLDPST